MPAHARDQHGHRSWTRSGDVLQFALPLTALGLSFVLDPAEVPAAVDGYSGLNWPGPHLDGLPQRRFFIGFLRAELTTDVLKYTINEKRPNGGNYSFPSGHTSSSFMGAEFIRKEYGWGWGAPAYLLASWTGYTRIDARAHYWHDVIAGAAIGIAANHDFDQLRTPLGRLALTPTLLSMGPAIEDEQELGGPMHEAAGMAPGLVLELRF